MSKMHSEFPEFLPYNRILDRLTFILVIRVPINVLSFKHLARKCSELLDSDQ